MGRRDGHRHRELRTRTGVDGLIDSRTTEGQLKRDVVSRTVAHNEVVPVLQRVACILQLGIERKVRVGPIQALTDTCRDTERTEVHRRILPDVVGVVLLRPVCRDRERVGLATTHPRIGEAGRDSLIVSTVGLSCHGELLVLTRGIGTPRSLLEEVARRDVVQRDTDRTDKRTRSPTTGQVELVAGLLDQREVHIHQLVTHGLDIGHNLLGVEVSHLRELTQGVHQHRTVVEDTRIDGELAADNLVVHTLVTRDTHLVDSKGLTLENLNLHIDRVLAHYNLLRLDLRHQVTVVLIKARYRGLLGINLAAHTQTLVHRLLVVHIALIHAEELIQVVGRIDRVTHPSNVANVELIALREVEVDADCLIVNLIDRIRQDGCVTITARVIEVEQQVFILGIILLLELAAVEEVYRLLVSLLECTEQALLGEVLVTRKGDLAHLNTRLAIDVEGYVYCILDCGVVGDLGAYIHITEALADKLLLDEFLVAVNHIIRKLGIGSQG